MLIQPDARPFTGPVGCAHFSQGTDERFDVSIQMPQALDGVGETPTSSRVLIQEFLSVRCHT